MILTKTDFVQFLHCPKSLWLLKREPENYPYGEFSAFQKKLTREGYEVEAYVRNLFEKERKNVSFQSVFESDDGLFARLDALEETPEGEVILYEIKSSTSVKTDASQNHIKDACFQKICAERAGQKIDRVYIVHLNGEYERYGDINAKELLTFEDVSQQVSDVLPDTVDQIDEALETLKAKNIDRNGCCCLLKSRANHCDTFEYFNPDIPKYSIYDLPRLSSKKRDSFVAEGLFDLRKLPSDSGLSKRQELVVRAAKADHPQIYKDIIEGLLSAYQFPLYFFDYETFASAIPLIDGARPHQHYPVQYSLHVVDKNGCMTHKEFLQREAKLPRNLVDQMENDFGAEGSIVSWHASFEKTQNKEMAKWFPEKAEFLTTINQRMVDLEDIFKDAYVDIKFKGSTSIKKVLPVICPHLGYQGLQIMDGANAMDAWHQMIQAEGSKAEEIAGALLAYCKMDTLAMVEIHRFLEKLNT